MRILYATRLFSGLHSSLAAGRWQPTGVPAIYKIIEALDSRADEVFFVFTAKDVQSDWRESIDRSIMLTGLNHPARVLAGRDRFPRWLRPLSGVLRELAHAHQILRIYRRERPSLVYLDHSNIFVAGILSLTTNARIVLRIMGVYPVMREALKGRGPAQMMLRWCYRRRYSLAICSQDGSGVEPWLMQALHPATPRIVLLNGVDEPISPAVLDSRLASLPPDRDVVMFLGKLEPAKGALEFADGFISAWRQEPAALHALVVGTGALAECLRAKFVAAGAQGALTLIERLPHDQVTAALGRADIYVSLNRLGNLSNANLEAARAGKAMIFPQSQPDIGVDVLTDALFPDGSVLRIPSTGDSDALAAAILMLHRDPSERSARAGRIQAAARKFLRSWDWRIAREIELLQHVTKADDVAPAL